MPRWASRNAPATYDTWDGRVQTRTREGVERGYPGNIHVFSGEYNRFCRLRGKEFSLSSLDKFVQEKVARNKFWSPDCIKKGTRMVKKPNFDFERREREKEKAAKRAEKAKAKSEKKAASGEAAAPTAGRHDE